MFAARAHEPLKSSVVVVSKNVGEDGRRTLTERFTGPASPEKIIAAERHVPEGVGPSLHEGAVLPWLIGGMGVVGLLAVASSLYLIDGWRATAIGVVWVLMGYAVAWSVVWGAGMFRAADEKHIEEHIIADDWKNDTPQ